MRRNPSIAASCVLGSARQSARVCRPRASGNPARASDKLPAMDVSVVRRRVTDTIERARREAAARRAANDAAGHAWDQVRESAVVPVCRTVLQVLRAEGHAFTLTTPGTSVRIVSDRSSQDWIEFDLDTHATPPRVVCSLQRTRGREITAGERPLLPGQPIEGLSEEDVLGVLLEVLGPFVER